MLKIRAIDAWKGGGARQRYVRYVSEGAIHRHIARVTKMGGAGTKRLHLFSEATHLGLFINFYFDGTS
jgi:hypothetical protein